MEKKILIEELNRINQLMGVSLLTESVRPFLDLGMDLVKTLEKKISKFGIKAEQALLDLRKATSEEEAIKALAKLSKEVPEVSDKIISTVIKTIDPNEKKIIDDFITHITSNVKSGKLKPEQVDGYIDFWTKKNVTTQFDSAKDVIKQSIKKDFEKKLEISNVKLSTKESKVVKGIEESAKNWFTTLKNAGLNITEIASVSKSFPFRKMRADLQLFAESIFNNRTKNLDNAIEEMMGKLKNFTEQLETANVDINLISDINVTLQSFKNSSKTDVSIFREKLIEGMRNAKGPKGERIPNSTISKVEDYLKKENPLDPSTNSWIVDFVPDSAMGKFYQDITNAKITFESKFWKISERIISFLTTGTIRTLEGFRDFYLKNGVKKGLALIYAYSMLFGKIIIPSLFAIVISIFQAFAANTPWGEGKDYWQRLKYLFQEKMIRSVAPLDKDGTINWIGTVIPFHFYWLTVKQNWESISKGEFRWIWDEAAKKTEEIKEKGKEEYEKLKEKKDELVNKGKEKIEPIKDDARTIAFKEFLKTKPNEKYKDKDENYLYSKEENGTEHRYYQEGTTFIEY